MAWQTLYISNPCKLGIKNNNLLITGLDEDTEPLQIAVSEVSVIVFDNLRSLVTTKVFETCAQNNILLIFTDELHNPAGLYFPYHRHSRFTKHAAMQIHAFSQALKNRLWQKIVRAKILNQASAVEITAQNKPERLGKLAMMVQLGDKTNIEAQAAKEYWRLLMFKDFKRVRGKGAINSALDYGYSIIRSALARSIAAQGLLPFLGIHHKSELNQFNLADDLIEPFRPLVEIKVKQLLPLPESNPQNFTRKMRLELIKILNSKIMINDKKTSVLYAVEVICQSLLKVVEEKNVEHIALPEI